jgi:2-methylisocitrate lyase-like PEP mutase family enzyme
VLPNVWDVESAQLVVAAGFPVVATSSHAVAASLGGSDLDVLDPALVFGVVARIAGAVSVPVTADIEAGYGLTPRCIIGHLLEAGAVGCNLEDSDHHGGGVLLDLESQARRIEEVRDSAAAAGIPVVVNARVDVFIRSFGPPERRVAEALRRGRAYLAAGADCVYPIGVVAEEEIRALVGEMGGPVNIWLRPDTPSLEQLSRIGVARISLAGALHRIASAATERALRALATGDSDNAFAALRP